MTKRMGRVVLLALASAIVVAIAFTYFWTKPYPMPELEEVPDMAALHLDFAEERSAYRDLQAIENEDERMLFISQSVADHPHNMAYMNELRIQRMKEGNSQLFIDDMASLAPSPSSRLQVALAYVDMLQDESLGTASLGQLSVQSIGILNELLDENPHNLLARYARGLNNLYWPLGLQRTDKALQDLGYCLAVAKSLEEEHPLALWPEIYVAYGDALVKSGQVDEGIAVWKDGSRSYPDHPALLDRTGVKPDEAEALVAEARGIDQFQRPDASISDLSILWSE